MNLAMQFNDCPMCNISLSDAEIYHISYAKYECLPCNFAFFYDFEGFSSNYAEYKEFRFFYMEKIGQISVMRGKKIMYSFPGKILSKADVEKSEKLSLL